jgi:hypothetical protein
MQLGLHPIGDFFIENSKSAGEEDGKEHPSEEQSSPGVQPIHGLYEAVLHGSVAGSLWD